MPNVSVLNTTAQVTGKTIAIAENDHTISGAWTFSGNTTFNGNVVLGNATSDTLTVTATIASNLLFTDATYDIGASGATRPRDFFLSRNATVGGTLAVTGVATLSATTIVLRGITYTLPTDNGDASEVLTTDGAGTLTWEPPSSPGTMQEIIFTAMANVPPTSAYATLDTRNNHPVLDFDADTDEDAVFGAVLPSTYTSGGLSVDIFWTATSAVAGDVVWNAAIERMNTDLDSDSFAAAQAATGTADGTSGIITKTTITFTDGAQMDSLAAGEAFRVKVTRDANNGSDTMTGDAEIHRVVVRET